MVRAILLRVFVVCVAALLLGPLCIVVIVSFSDDRLARFPVSQFSLDNYSNLVSNPLFWDAVVASVLTASVSVLANIAAAVPAALVLDRIGGRARAALNAFLTLGVTAPTIVSAFAFLALFRSVGLASSPLTLGLVVAVTCLPFMLWAVAAARVEDEDSLIDAAKILGAPAWQIWMRIRLPLLLPGIVTGSALVFVMSITDFVIAQVLTTTSWKTLPVFAYSGLRDGVTPELAAISVLFLVVAAVLLLVASQVLKLFRNSALRDL